ncbi:Peptide deformylase [Ostreococcus tauri]|nr:Peptide deformylase [Ostreococcus tauri]CEF97368.1 Peptide deformylase [Ostreococcus tauri]|eukprot:XP_022838654.1 Peptide deformylase [Ostreococcus tauri]
MKRGESGGASSSESVAWSEPLAIAKYPAPCLRAKNAPIETFDANLEQLSKAMFKIMYETVGCGLAAPQVGVNYRMMVYNEAGEPGKGREVVLCNPKIVKYSKEKDFFEEGCLSFPKMYADVERPLGVQIEAQNLKGKKFKMTLEGFEARVFQHEYDHLDGVLYHDRMSPEVRATIQGTLDGFVEAYPGEEKAL